MAPSPTAGRVAEHPPCLRRRDYARVAAQLLWRMRLDLLVFGVVLALARGLALMPASGSFSPMGLSVLGIAVSIFIGFRNTQAISRWWEARTLWAGLVAVSRQWRDGLLALLPSDQLEAAEGRHLLEVQVAMVWSLNFELRPCWRADLHSALGQLLDRLGLASSTSSQQLSRHRAVALQQLQTEGWIDGLSRARLLEIANACHVVIAGLEKIRNTPLPPAYDVFVRLITWFYRLALIAEFEALQRAWIGVALFLGFLLAERIGSYVEDPFDRDGSSFGLPMNSICASISADLLAEQNPFQGFQAARNPMAWD